MESLTSCREHFNQSQGSKYQLFTTTALDSTLNFEVYFMEKSASLEKEISHKKRGFRMYIANGWYEESPINREH